MLGNVDGAYWTLQHELSFYIIIGMIIFLKFNKHIEKLCVTWVITRIVLLILPDILLFNYMRKAFRLLLGGNTYGHMFISGAILRCIEIRLLNQQKMNKNRLWLCVLSLALLCCVILQFYFFSFTYGVIYAAFLILIIVAIYANKKNYRTAVKGNEDSKTSSFYCIDIIPIVFDSSKYWLYYYQKYGENRFDKRNLACCTYNVNDWIGIYFE